MTTENIIAGAVFEVAYPFIRDTYTELTPDGVAEVGTWRPGIRYELVPPDDSAAFADAMGTQILTVISTHRPGRFPERVFFTRQWRDPNGHTFGKNKLRMTTKAAFRALARGYRVEFRLFEKHEAAA